MNIMTKRGTHDNIVTYEHICDTKADLDNIPKQQSTLGSVAIVVKDEGDTLGAYIANSEGEWSLIADISGGGGGGGSTEIYICGPEEVDPETGLPSIEDPSPSIIYLVPNNDDPNVMYDEYIYKDGEWELFGTSSIDLSRKADIDGTYPDMTVGKADQLNTTEYVENNDPYLFRTTGGTLDTNNIAYEDMIVGGTIAWNQINNCATASTTTNGVTITKLENNKWHFEGTATAQVTFIIGTYSSIAGHVYYHGGWPNTGSATTWYVTTSKYTDAYILKRTSAGGYAVTIYIEAEATVNFDASCMICDLTQMFGTQTIRDTSAVGSTSTPLIANYIYDLEQTTPGAGVAWFRKFFPKSYYPYNPGELMSVKAVSHDTVGLNAYDPVSGTAKLLGGNEYLFSGAYDTLTFTDIDGNTQTITTDLAPVFTPQNNGILTVTGGDSTTTCVQLVWSGYRNGEFEPYVKHSYALDSNLELRGVPMLDANNKLYYDGDTYKSDGTVTRKYKIVDLGTLNWAYNAPGQWGSPDISSYRGDGYFGICSRIFIYDRARAYNNQGTEPYIAARGGYIWIRNTNWAGYTNAEVKTALNGVYLVYRLANGYETTETAESFETPQIIDDFGTEEYVDTRDIPIPVGHITHYPSNLRDKLQHLPFPAESDGEYVIKQVGQNMTLIPHVNNDDDSHGNIDETKIHYNLTAGSTSNIYRTDYNSLEYYEDTALETEQREKITLFYDNIKRIEYLEGRNPVIFTQLIQNGNFNSNLDNWEVYAPNPTTYNVNNNALSMQGNVFGLNQAIYGISNHVYVISVEMKSDLEQGINLWSGVGFLDGGSIASSNNNFQLSPDWRTYSFAIDARNANIAGPIKGLFGLEFTEINSETIQIDIRNIMLIDLTLFFSGEQVVDGDVNRLLKNYHPYTLGKIIGSKLEAFENINANWWDEEWEVGGLDPDTGESITGTGIRSKNFIRKPMAPDPDNMSQMKVYFSIPSYYIDHVLVYDENKNYIDELLSYSEETYTYIFGTEACYFKFSLKSNYGSTYKNDIMISYGEGYASEKLGGCYRPYLKCIYPVDSNVELYTDDSYYPDGIIYKINKKIVLNGTEDWTILPNGDFRYYYIDENMNKDESILYSNVKYNVIFNGNSDTEWFEVNNNENITLEQFLEDISINPIEVLYKLNDYETEYGTHYEGMQKIQQYGIERYINNDSISTIPKIESYYATNLINSIIQLPQDYGKYALVSLGGEDYYYELVNPITAVGGNSPTLRCKEGRYICGILSSLKIQTLPSNGIVNIRFTSGSTPTTLTIPNTVIWANGFDPSSLEANSVYEFSIEDGVYGVAARWDN